MKEIIFIFLAAALIGVVVITPLVAVPIVLTPNSDQPDLATNQTKVEEYVDEFLDKKMKEIVERLEKLRRKNAKPNLKEQRQARGKIKKFTNKYNSTKFSFDVVKAKIPAYRKKVRQLNSKISEIDSEISDIRDEINEREEEAEESEEGSSANTDHLEDRIDRLQEKQKELREEIKRIENKIIPRLKDKKKKLKEEVNEFEEKLAKNKKEYKKIYSGKPKFVDYQVIGIDETDYSKLKEALKERIDFQLLYTIHSIVKKDTKIENENVVVDDTKMVVNSKEIIMQVLEHSLDSLKYKKPKYIFTPKDSKNLFTYSRGIKVFEGISDVDSMEVEFTEHEIEKIPYYQAVQVENYYVRPNKEIVDELLTGTSYLTELINQTSHTKQSLRKEIFYKLGENWLPEVSKDIEQYTGNDHFKQIKEEVDNRPRKNKEIVYHAERLLNGDLPYFPKKKLERPAGSTSVIKEMLAKEIPDRYKEIEMELPEKVPGDYVILNDIEKKIWINSNKYKKQYILNEKQNKRKVRIKKSGSLTGAKLRGKLIDPAGIGNEGLLQYLSANINGFNHTSLKGLYRNCKQLYDTAALRPGDFAILNNPEFKTSGSILGIYAGDNKFYYYDKDTRSYKLQEKEDWNVIMRYYPVEQER